MTLRGDSTISQNIGISDHDNDVMIKCNDVNIFCYSYIIIYFFSYL